MPLSDLTHADASSPSPTGDEAPAVDPASLDQLDAVLFESRRWVTRPGHRRRFHAMLDRPVELATIRVLRAVEGHVDGDPTIGDVAATIGVDPSTASRLVDGVVSRGELERRTCDHDRRRTRLRLTPAGHDTLASVTRARRAVLSEITAGWHDDDIRRLAALLERLGLGFDALEDAMRGGRA